MHAQNKLCFIAGQYGNNRGFQNFENRRGGPGGNDEYDSRRRDGPGFERQRDFRRDDRGFQNRGDRDRGEPRDREINRVSQ